MSKATAGKMIREARKFRGWTIEEMAERLSASPTTIHNWETGKTAPGIQDINPLCTALSLSPDLLLIELGVTLTPPAAAKLPRELIQAALSMDDDGLRSLSVVAKSLQQTHPRRDDHLGTGRPSPAQQR